MTEIPTPQFLFAVCQRGAEAALKAEFARAWPDFRSAFSRPGFVTFKLPPAWQTPQDFDVKSVFARSHGFSLGKVEGDDPDQMARGVWQLAGELRTANLHVWQRDSRLVGDRGFEPEITPLADQVGQRLLAVADLPGHANRKLPLNQLAPRGGLVLDCVVVDPGQWWIGWHRASSVAMRWPGGIPPITVDGEIVGRAYKKMSEALLWSRLPIEPGELCVEIGSAPGGSCQCLLQKGLQVIGIDPAEMAPSIAEHASFTHIRKRAAEVKRREFQQVRWLMADANVAPKHTLDSVEPIVTHRDVHLRGLLLTLKLLDWSLAERIPEYIERVRSWGYHYVKARQLAFNRREVCLVALRRRSLLRKVRRGQH